MNDPLWKKTGSFGPTEEIMEFLAGEDVILDRELLPFDILASAAHADGLQRIGILSEEENLRMQEALATLAQKYQGGEITLESGFEDGHSALESWLVEMLGPVGEKIHTGRSRNDQVAVAMRLFLKDRLATLTDCCAAVASACMERAEAEQETAIPGHTHLQKAMPSSAGLWLAGHAEAFIDNAEFAASVCDCIDASPLGTAAGFGINLPLARDKVADELGFDRLVVNPQYAQNSRGKAEMLALSALSAATLDLRRLAWDFSLFATFEFGYIELPERYCTGSSIMPNKNNPDVVELLRAVHAVVVGAQAELNAILSLPSGYHRDLQATKPPVMRAFAKGLQALVILPGLVHDFSWNRERLAAALTPELFATDLATDLAAGGTPFRQAYREVANSLSSLEGSDPRESLARRVSPGGCGNLGLATLQARLDKLQAGRKKE